MLTYLIRCMALLCLGLLLDTPLFAQKAPAPPMKFGSVGPADFVPAPAASDTAAAVAEYLCDYGTSRIVGSREQFQVVFERTTRLQIHRKAGYDYATVRVPLYIRDGMYERLTNLRGNTYNLQEGKVVLCVPLSKATKPDTVWLECTSQTNPFGYMSSFTGNRHALLVTPQGGRLVRTPQYLAADNRRERLADVYLDAQGSATASIRTRLSGLEQDAYASLASSQNLADQKKVVAEHLPLASFSISKLSYQHGQQQPVPVLTENLGLTLPGWASVAGKRAFLTPNLLSRWGALPATVGERRTPIWLDNAFSYADTIRIHVPAGFKPESLPAQVQLTTAFGTYSSQVQALPDGTLLYVRRLLMPRTRFAREDYPAYQEFRRRISQADKAQVVLVKTDA